jgi:hypothetical protein
MSLCRRDSDCAPTSTAKWQVPPLLRFLCQQQLQQQLQPQLNKLLSQAGVMEPSELRMRHDQSFDHESQWWNFPQQASP